MKKNKLVIANWKMKLGLSESVKLALFYKRIKIKNSELVVCPSMPYIKQVAEVLPKTILLGSQDCFWENSGAFTGEVSPLQLKELGCSYVILGHSERRTYLGETNEMVHKKTKAVLEANMVPVICVGETFEERQKGNQDYTLIQQVTQSLEGLELKKEHSLVVAYEPVWVIGTGQAIEPKQAELAHQIIWQTLFDIFGSSAEEKFRVIYGGSVDENNVADFLSLQDTSGVLIGGASLKPDQFSAIIQKL